MNLRVFEYLLALEEQGGFHRAAAACNVSQPALSIQIKKVETELGIQLLERGHKEFIFTPCGLEILERARSIMQQVGEIEELAELWHDPYAGAFSLGAFPTLAPYYFPQIIDHLTEAYPNLQFNLVEDKTDALVERLKSGALDAAFLALPIIDEGLEHGTVFSEEFFLGVSPNHQLASRKIIDIKQLSKEKMLLLEEGHCLRGQALDYCASAGIGEVLNFRATSMETLLQMVSMGRGMSFIPNCVARKNSSIHYVRLKGGDIQRTVGLFWRKSHVRRDLMLELIDDLSREYTA
jgi:LysR family hydrogen peroxide-inducible transcriptional activator